MYWLRTLIARWIFRLYVWLDGRCKHCGGAGCGLNYMSIPVECPECEGSGYKR